MSRRPAILAILFAASSGCAAPETTLSPAHRAAIVDSVQTMLTTWRDAFNTMDFERAASFYSSDPEFRWFEGGELKYRSATEMYKVMEGERAMFRALSLSLIEPRVTALAPGVAVVTMNFAQKMTDSAGAVTGVAGAVSATVVHADSGWRFLTGHAGLLEPPADSIRPGARRGS